MIRGKLVVIPIENSFLYVVPLYLKAEGTNFPQTRNKIDPTRIRQLDVDDSNVEAARSGD